MNLKDYAPYYLGCRCLNTWFPEGHEMYDRGWQLKAIDTYSDNPYGLNCYAEFTWTDSIKLILRKLEDCPFEIGEMRLIRDSITSRIFKYAAITDYLTKQYIDVFGLIKAGLAIDGATLPK